MKLRVSAFTVAGLVIDGYITESIRPEDATAAGIAAGGGYHVHCHYLAPSTGRRVDAVLPFHHHDVCPFGWSSPSRVYSLPGRHTNLGLIRSFDADRCVFEINDPETGEILSAALGDLELLPVLTGDQPTPPWAVGTKVLARRHHVPGLSAGYITAANSDLTYTIQFIADSECLDNNLHRDVMRWDPALVPALPTVGADDTNAFALASVGHLMSRLANLAPQRKQRHSLISFASREGTAASSPVTQQPAPPAVSRPPRGGAGAKQQLILDTEPTEERVTVRSVVLVALMGQHIAIIVQAMGQARYRALLLSSQRVVVVSESHITCVRPPLHEGLGSDPDIVKHFLTADEALSGCITWGICKRALKDTTPSFGQPIPDAKLRSIYAELHCRSGRPIGAVLGKTLVEDGDLPLTFADFEFAFRRYRNAL